MTKDGSYDRAARSVWRPAHQELVRADRGKYRLESQDGIYGNFLTYDNNYIIIVAAS